MAKLVLTLGIGETARRFLELSRPAMEAYAQRVGADFAVMGESIYDDPLMVHFNKLRIRDYFARYRRILYLDADVLIRPDAPDIFAAVPAAQFAAWDESMLYERPELVRTIQRNFGPVSSWTRTIFNLGVFVASRRHAGLFQPVTAAAGQLARNHAGIYSDQHYLNWRMHDLKLRTFSLPVVWNWNPICGYIHPQACFVHFMGAGFFEPARDRLKPAQEPMAKRLRQMQALLDAWKRKDLPARPAIDLCVTSPGVRSAVSLPHYILPAGRYDVQLRLREAPPAAGPMRCVLFGKLRDEVRLAEWVWDAREAEFTGAFTLLTDLSYPQFCLASPAEAERVTSLEIRWRGGLPQPPTFWQRLKNRFVSVVPPVEE